MKKLDSENINVTELVTEEVIWEDTYENKLNYTHVEKKKNLYYNRKKEFKK